MLTPPVLSLVRAQRAKQASAMSVVVKAAEPWRCTIESAMLGKQFRKEDSLQQVSLLHVLLFCAEIAVGPSML